MSRLLVLAILLGLVSEAPHGQAAQSKRTLSELLIELKKGENQKLKAIEELEALGEKAADAVPALIDLLPAKNENVRLHAIMAMRKIGKPAVEPLAKALAFHYPNEKVPQAKIDDLIRKLGSANFVVRDKARKELEAVGLQALESLRRASKGADLETNRRAAEIAQTIEGHADIRYYLVWGLAFVGPPAKEATPMVLKALADPAPQVRRKAAFTLGRIDPDPDAVVAALVAALGDADADVRESAAVSLPKMSKQAVPVLIKALDDKSVRPMAMRVLGSIGSEAAAAIPALNKLLCDFMEPTSSGAADALAGIGAPSIKVLNAAAADDNAPTRALAVNALFRIGAAGVPSLIDLVGSKHADVRGHAAASLGNAGVRDKSVVVALSFATKDPERQVRLNALQSIKNIGPAAKFAEPHVVERLTDIDQHVRLSAFFALQALGVDPLPGLKKALGHPDLATRIKTAVTMTDLNYQIDLAAPILLEGIKQKDPLLRMQSANALSLRSLQPDDVLPIFIARLEDGQANIRREVALGISRYGAKGAKAAPALIEALEDVDDAVVGQAMATLRAVGGDPKLLFPAMVKVLRRDNTTLHAPAAQIIFQVGPEAVDDITALLKNEKAPGVRLACLQTLAMVGPGAKNAVGELTRALGDASPRHRMTAARALGNIGPDAKAALDALTKAENDEDANVKAIAAAAIEQIKSDPNQKEFVVKGVLTPGDPFDKVRTQMFHVVHTYKMKAGTKYQIDLNSTWDNYLRLENAQGAQLALDDDGGGFPNARVIFIAPADGWYRIIVTSYGPKMNGPYTLRVK